MTAARACVFLADERLLGAELFTRHVSFPVAAARAYPTNIPGWARKRLKFLARAWMHPSHTRTWLARLTQPDISELWALRPRLAIKLYRPYLSCDWDVPERCAAILNHYNLLPRLIASTVLPAIYKNGIHLLRIHHSDSSLQLNVRLFYRDQFEKEEKLTLAVEDAASGLMLAGLSFSLIEFAGRRTLIIGEPKAVQIRALETPSARSLKPCTAPPG